MKSLRRLGALSSHCFAETAPVSRATARPPPCRRSSTTHSGNGIQPVPAVDGPSLNLGSFRELAFVPAKPLLMRAAPGGNEDHPRRLPATSRWFEGKPGPSMRLSSYLEQFATTPLPYELMYPQGAAQGKPLARFLDWLVAGAEDPSTASTAAAMRPGLAELLDHCISSSSSLASPTASPDADGAGNTPRLIRLEAPLALFLAAVEYNATHRTADPVTQLYIAQAPLSELPHGLQLDVPAPDLVQHAGRGDVYDSSVWLGLEPTYTPWHRDPNPNLFCQICSSKTVRMMAPVGGECIFRQVQEELMKSRGRERGASASSRIRGEEMMQGPERELLHHAVWGEGEEDGERTARGRMLEVRLDAGDMLFVPKGWWHSVRSVHADGRLNGSVNWWFR